MKRRQSRRVGVRTSETNLPGPDRGIERLEPRTLFSAVATYQFGVSHFVEDANTSMIYATVPANNSVAVIDATTLNVVAQIPIGSQPLGIAISQDDSTVYVADSGTDQIGVIDTSTNTAGTPIQLSAGQQPTAVEVGTNNRLWVQAGGIEQIDATTGASTGPSLSTNNGQINLFIYSGDMVMNAAGTALYYTTFGLSPSYLYKYDVTGASPIEDWGISPGSNGRDIALSYNGQVIANPCGAPYDLPLYSTNNTSVVGTLATGASAFAFSPDDKIGYEVNGTNIEIYDMSTYLMTGSIGAAGNASKVFVDNTGQFLFAGEGSFTEVFSTGRMIPVAPTVTTQPQNVSVSAGSSASFTAGASGSPTPTLQWQESTNGGGTWTNINGATGGTYSIPSVGGDNGFEFRAVFTNAGGTATSNAATLTVVGNGKLAFTQQPTGTVSGLLLTPPFIVDVENASGTLLGTDNSLVTLSISSGPAGGTLVGGTQVNAVNGVATFSSLALPVAGAYTIEARDGTLTPAFSASFTSTGVPSLVFVQQPTNTTAGVPISPAIVVDIDTAAGPLASTDNSIVTLSILSGPAGANLGGTVTVNAISGVATFDDIVPTVPGTYTLLANDTGYVSATSASFQAAQGAGGPTTTTLAASANPIASGGVVTFTATVGSPSGMPTGTVQFFDGGVSLGMASLSNGKATLTTSGIPAGTQYITAAYFGTAGFISSTSSPLIESVASQASLSAAVSGNDPSVFVPGNSGTVNVTITNQGASTARGVVGIQLFATTDGIAADGIALQSRPSQASVQLRGGASRTLRVSVAIPSTFAPGTYSIVAVLTPMRGLTSANISSAPQVGSPFSQAAISLSFGLVGSRHGVKLLRTEPDGTVVTYTLAGPGEGTLSGDGITSPMLLLTGTTSGSRVTITTRGGSGGLTLAGLSANSPVGSITAPGTTLAGVLDVAGSLGRLTLASLNGANLAAANFGSVVIGGAVTNSRILAGASFGADGVPGGGDDSFAAGTINSIRIAGSVTTSVIAAGLNPVDGIYLNGNDTLIAGGRIRSAAIGGTLSSDSRMLASILPHTALVSHTAVDTTTDARFTF